MVNLKKVLVTIILVSLVGMIAAPGLAAESGATQAEYQSVFKSPQGEAAYRAAYDRALEAWPVPYETRYVPTAYGETHVIISGPEDGEPLILIPGALSDATSSWSVSIAAFSRTYRVYALDTIGDVGKSKMVRPFPDRAGVVEWLTDVLDALGIEKASMAGYSQGGFFTAIYPLEKPERLKKIVLLAPAGTLAPFGKDFLLGAMLPTIVGGLANDVYEVRRSAAYTMEMMSQLVFNVSQEELAEMIKDEDLAELMSIFREESVGELGERIDSAIEGFLRNQFAPGNPIEFEKFGQVFLAIKYRDPGSMEYGPHALPDEDLKKIKTPTLLLIGDHEILYLGGANQAVRRSEGLVENIQTVLIPNASHMVLFEQTDLVNSHILDFLSGDK